MPFRHKLAHRLALLKTPLLRGTLLALPLVAVTSCEKPIPTGTTEPPTQLVVSPQNATLQPDQVQDFTAVGLTAAGDTARISVVWSATGGTVDTNSVGGRHYGHYHNSTCGQYSLSASEQPGGLSGSAAITVVCPASVASVSMLPTAVTLSVGLTQQIAATPRDANGNALTGRTITWSTSDASVATVSASGLVTAVAVGSATITATCEGKTGTTSVTVTAIPVATVTVSPASASVVAGQTQQLTATLKDANGNVLTGRPVSWSSNNAGVANVDGNGLVTARTAGSATITATSEGKSGTSAITVTPAPVASVSVTPASGSVQVGATLQLTATPKDANGNPLTGRTITWQSSDNTIASVNSSGLVTGVAAGGPVTITATSEGQSGTAAVTVTSVPVPVASVSVTPSSASLQVGQTQQLTATLRDANGNVLTGRTVTWSSSNTTAASVSSSGLVTAKAAGSATITATSEGQSGTASVTVTPVPVASVTVTPASGSVAVGGTLQLTATPKDANGNPLSGRTITWQSSDNTIASVNASGLVTGVAAGGPVTITATSEGQSGTAAVTVTPSTGGAQFDHVFVVVEENNDYVDVTSSSMPYLTGLAAQYGLATQYYANTHPSIGNYFELLSGQIITNNDSYSSTVSADNVVRHLVAAGKTWKSYAEGLPSVGFVQLDYDDGTYASRHNAIVHFTDVHDNATQAQNVVPFTQFATDLANGAFPNYSMIVPDLCNDAHDCSLNTADSWLQANIDPLVQSTFFQQNNCLLIVVFDESGGDNTNGGGRVYWVAVSPTKSKRAYQSTTLYQHQSTLRLTLKGLGVTTFPGDAATAPDMSEFFNP
jgi:uncharacterized protein YjdB